MFKSTSFDKDFRATTNSYLLWVVAVTLAIGFIIAISNYLSPANVLRNYERFFDYSKEFNNRVSQIHLMQDSLALVAEDRTEYGRILQELNAIKYSCRNLANTYNVDSLKLNRELFKSVNLPHELDASLCK